MQSVMFVVAVIVIAGVALGFFLGWFNLSPSNDEHKSNVTLSVDKDKFEADKDKAVDKARDLGHQAVDKIAPSTK